MSQSKEHFAYIPESTTASETFRNLSSHTRLLFVYMAVKRHGVDDWFTYSYKEIRADTRFQYKKIATGIKEMEEAEILKYQHGGLEANRNKYYIDPSWVERNS